MNSARFDSKPTSPMSNANLNSGDKGCFSFEKIGIKSGLTIFNKPTSKGSTQDNSKLNSSRMKS